MDTNIVMVRLNDADLRYTTAPARAARNILMHERSMCDACDENNGNNRVYMLEEPEPSSGYRVMWLLCTECAEEAVFSEEDAL